MKRHTVLRGVLILLVVQLLVGSVAVQVPVTAANKSSAVANLDVSEDELTPHTYTDQEYGFSFEYPQHWQAKVSFNNSDQTDPVVINRRIITYPDVNSLSQIRVDVWENLESLQLQEWFEKYELPLHPKDATVQQSPDIQIAGLPGILVHEPAAKSSHHGRISALVGYNNIIIRFDYYMNEGGQYQQVFLNIVRSMKFTLLPTSEARLPEAPLVELQVATLQDSSCCGWYDPNDNRYPCSGGNCTWWAKYKRPDASNHWGDAWMWRDRARQDGFPVEYSARQGAIVVLQPEHPEADTSDGHVAYVTSVEGNGKFKVSDMGWKRGCNVGDKGVRYYSLSETGNEVVTFIYTKAPPNQPPHKPTLLSPANGSVTSNTSVTLEWKDNGDPDDGPRGYNDFAAELSSDGTKVAESGWIDETSWSVSDLDPGTYSWKVKAGDGDTNSGFGASWSFTVDTAAPTGDLTLNYDWQQASGVNVPLQLTASDEHSRVSEMRLGQDCSSLGDWLPYQSARWWQLDGQHGDTAGVCVQYRDRAGNESATVEKSLTLDFYPAQPASSRYRLAADVVALGGSQASSQNYSLHATSGQVLASGDYASSANYRAALGYWAAVQRDTTPPVVTVESLLTKDATPALHGTVDDAQATVELLLNNNTYNATNKGDGTWLLADNTISPTLSDGTYEVVASATDRAGNVGTDSTTDELIVDTTPPSTTIKSLLTKDATPALHGTVDDAQATVELLLDSQTYTVTNHRDGTWTLADNTISPALSDGTYDVVITATDKVGNMGTDDTSNELTVDTTPPSTTIESLLTKDATPALHGTVDDAQATVELLLDSQPYTPTNKGDGTWLLADNTISPALSDGTYDVVITATDTIGHVGTNSTSDELIIDTKAPSVTVDVLITSVTTPALRGTVDDASATMELVVDGAAYTATNQLDGSWILAEGVITPTLQDGTYDVVATATDRAGNVGSDNTTDELTIDVTPPEEPSISGVVSDTLRSEDGRLTITGTAEASSTVTIMLNGEVISTTTTDEQGNWSFDNGDETLPDGEHTLVIQTTDAAGNTSTREVTLVVDTVSSYDLQLSIGGGKRTVTTAEVLTYTLRYTNTGAITASGVLLTAQVPTNTTVVAAGTADWQCSGTSCSLAVGEVAVGAHGEQPFAVTIAEAMPANVNHVVLHASCQGNESSERTERQPANNDASITTQVDAQPDMRIALQSQDYNQQTGLLTLTLGYGNQGNQDAVQVWLQVSFPSPVTSTLSNAAATLNDAWDCPGTSTSGGRCVYEIGELAAGEQGSQQVEFDTQGYTGNLEDLTFEATITDGSERERNPADNTIEFTPQDTPEPVSPGAKQSLHLPLVLR